MKLEVPDEFIEVLKSVSKEIGPEHVVDALKWASENPEKARKTAEAYKRLGMQGKHEFADSLWLGFDPGMAIENAVKRDLKARERRSLLGKAIAHSKRDGYKFKLPNGVECVVLKDCNDDGYWFNFKVAGEEIGVLYKRRALSFALEELKHSSAPSRYGIRAIRFRGKDYYGSTSRIWEHLLKAVEENQKPEVLATIGV